MLKQQTGPKGPYIGLEVGFSGMGLDIWGLGIDGNDAGNDKNASHQVKKLKKMLMPRMSDLVWVIVIAGTIVLGASNF